MRILHGILLVGATSLLFAVGPVRPNQAPFSVTLTTEKPVVKAGEEVWVRIQLTNKSKRDVNCTSADVGPVNLSYQYDVHDSAGNPVKKVIAHPELIPGHFRFCNLKPGESITNDNRVSWLYDMTRPGKYVIQVSRVISDNEKSVVVKSNTITITVTE